MSSITRRIRQIALALVVAAMAVPLAVASVNASEIKYIVNNQPVTSYDIARRAAFLRLQNRKGNLQQLAAEDMIDQAVRTAEMKRLNIRVTDEQVAGAYERFARSNNLSPSQMDNILNQSGVTKAHFREFMRAQMGWGQVIDRNSGSGLTNEQDVVQKMLQQGGGKPSATEYMLQQVIFVVPAAERKSKLAQRKREAEAMRQRFNGCATTKEFAKGLIDVTVRDLGRILAPELPGDWEKQVKATQPGSATAVRETERGVEFIGVCSAREVSDDRVAELVYQSEARAGASGDDEVSKKLTAELRAKAQIVRR